MKRAFTALFAISLTLTSATVAAKPKLAIIIDDLGYELMPRNLAQLPPEVSVSILPFTEQDTAVALTAFSQKREVLIHLPMASPEGTPQEPNTLSSSMTEDQFKKRIQEAVYRVPHAVAANNHMGSELTKSVKYMDWVMETLAENQVGFVDSRTSAKSVAEKRARAKGIPAARRHIFLDHQESATFIRRQLRQAVNYAHRHGSAVAIGHPYPITIEVLSAALPELDKRVELVPISHLLSQPDS